MREPILDKTKKKKRGLILQVVPDIYRKQALNKRLEVSAERRERELLIPQQFNKPSSAAKEISTAQDQNESSQEPHKINRWSELDSQNWLREAPGSRMHFRLVNAVCRQRDYRLASFSINRITFKCYLIATFECLVP